MIENHGRNKNIQNNQGGGNTLSSEQLNQLNNDIRISNIL
jgi:hypothetical protein